MDCYDAIVDYLKNDVKTTESLFPKVPLSPCYGITKVPSKVKRVIFNPPATIILWNDGTKSVVKCQNGEPFDPEKGFALAYLKKLLGNDNTFNKEINKWVKWEAPKKDETPKRVGMKFVPSKAKEFTFTVTADNIKIEDLL